MSSFWYLDFETYIVDSIFYVKEIAILRNDRTQCYTYYISHHGTSRPTSYEYNRQESQLLLPWSFGDTTFDEAILDIKLKICNDIVIFSTANDYDIKKFKFMKSYLPQLFEQPLEMGYLLINCANEKCDENHGFCARRRVHEIRYYDYNNLA
jgi:hypothetical protein